MKDYPILDDAALNRRFQVVGWLGILDLHFIDAVGSLECSLLYLINLVPAHVQNLKIGQSVEQSQSWDLGDDVVGEDEVGGGGGDVSWDVLQTLVRTIHFASVTSNNKIFRLSHILATQNLN